MAPSCEGECWQCSGAADSWQLLFATKVPQSRSGSQPPLAPLTALSHILACISHNNAKCLQTYITTMPVLLFPPPPSHPPCTPRPRQAVNQATILELLRLSLPDWPLILTAFVAGAVAALMAALIPFYTGLIIDAASIDPDRWGGSRHRAQGASQGG